MPFFVKDRLNAPNVQIGLKLLALGLLVLGLLVWNLSLGSADIPWASLGRFLLLGERDNLILLDFRWPRSLGAILAGASLSACGLMLQTYFRNPIAGPYLLGVSSGAGLGVALLYMGTGWLSLAFLQGPLALASAAALGSALVLAVLLGAAWRGVSGNSLLLLGVLLGSASSALVALLEYFSPPQSLQQFVFWGMGQLSALRREDLAWLLPLQLLAWAWALLRLAKPLNILLLGERYARSMGLNPGHLRLELLLLTALLSGSITAFCGPIAFVGTAVPHLARWYFRTADHRLLIPGSLLLGAALVLLCQALCLLPGGERSLPLNALCALLGAPVVFGLILKPRG